MRLVIDPWAAELCTIEVTDGERRLLKSKTPGVLADQAAVLAAVAGFAKGQTARLRADDGAEYLFGIRARVIEP